METLGVSLLSTVESTLVLVTVLEKDTPVATVLTYLYPDVTKDYRAKLCVSG